MKFNKKINKKAMYAIDTAPFYAVFSIVVSGLFIFFVMILTSHSSDNVSIPENLEEFVLYQRFLRSPDCFVYEDLSGRSHQLLIDLNKFTEDNLNTCYESGNNKNIPAFKLTLSFLEKTKTIKTSNWDAKGIIKKKEPAKNIIVVNKNKKYPGKIIIEIQNEKIA